MSPALPVVSGQETVTALKKIGFAEIGQRGSHVKLRSQRGRTVLGTRGRRPGLRARRALPHSGCPYARRPRPLSVVALQL